MKSLTSLWRELATETASWCGTSALFDCKTVEERTELEGESFLTITLPQFGKDFERCLELGFLDVTNLFKQFEKRRGLPLFLGGYLRQIFSTSGTLLDEPSIDCIRSVRQLTLVFGKMETMCSDARVSRAMRQYVKIEQELKEMDTSSFEEFLPLFQKASTLLYADVFAEIENNLLGMQSVVARYDDSHHLNDPVISQDIFLDFLNVSPEIGGKPTKKIVEPACIVDPTGFAELTPRHGPGATADRLRGNAKFDLVIWPQRLERVFPYGDYALPSWRYYYQLDRVQFLEPREEQPVKVVSVPKTHKTPRIIAEEPTAMQYMQQALAQQFVNRLEDHFETRVELPTEDVFPQKGCDFGKWFIGFTRQEPNRLMACEGSLNGNLATLDLSEASDRVLNQHVELLLSRFPRLSEAVQATRSTKADVPGHGVIQLAKFASMGSALCFPVESMVFTAIVFAAISYERRVPLSRGLLMSLRGKVRVYGDDIVVPVEYVHRVIQFLEAFGLLVNKDKSFWNGKFRESCGGDYYDGEWVTPIRLRHGLPRSLADVPDVVGLVSFRNLLYWGGYWKTVRKLDEYLKNLLGEFPIVADTSVCLGRSSALPYKAEKTHPETHTPLVRGCVVKFSTPKSPISGEGALLKFGLKRGLQPTFDARHLERQGRPVAVRIKHRWIRPY